MLHRKSSAPVQRRMAAQRTSFAQGPNPSRSMSRASRRVHVSAALLDVAQLKVSLKSVSARLPSMVATALRRAVDPKVGWASELRLLMQGHQGQQGTLAADHGCL